MEKIWICIPKLVVLTTSFGFLAAVVVTNLLKISLFPNTYPFGIHNHHINKPTEISALYSNIRTLLKYPHCTQISALYSNIRTLLKYPHCTQISALYSNIRTVLKYPHCTQISALYSNLRLFTWRYYFPNSEFRMATIISKQILKS